MDNPVIFVVLIVAVIVGAMLLGGFVRRSVVRSGGRYGRRVAASRVDDALGALGATLVVHAPEPMVREIVDEVIRHDPRRFSLLEHGAYGLRFVEEDDGIVRLAPDANGVRLQLESAREYLGAPKASGFWADLRERVGEAATSRGLTVSDGAPLSYERRELDGGGVEWVWTR
ncbi:MAG: hypothetical protein J7484_01930 [Microbacterium sp.]|nr:hypothetical protein [Microbacterium sp.]